jgi:iron complex transport system ATP-binding protein
MPPAELAYRRAVVAQSSDLSFPFTAREVVLLGATVPGFDSESDRLKSILTNALADVGLTHLAGRPYPLLSGGERQRVQIARALCQLAAARPFRTDPPLLLLDEPTSSLDLAHQRMILLRLRRFAETGGAAIAVLHDINLAAAYCDRLVIMKDGRVLAHGKPRDVIVSDVLSEAYSCHVDANRLPPEVIPFALPVTDRTPLSAGPIGS